MSIGLESESLGNLSREEFRDSFIESIPLGTRVKNIILIGPNGEYLYATTAGGKIYDAEDSLEVNITGINGDPGLSGVWSATYTVRADQ
jgi:hypothetical protein